MKTASATRRNGAFVFLLLLMITPAFAQVLSIPGLGEAGFKKKDATTYTLALPKIGTFDFRGKYNNSSDFDLLATVPVSNLTDYIPVIGQILGLLGLDSVTINATDNGLGYNVHLEEGGLGMFREYICDEITDFKLARVATEAVISSLELVSLDMDAKFNGDKVRGKLNGELSVVGIKMGFSADGDLSYEAVIDSVVDKIAPAVSDYAVRAAKVVYNQTKDAVSAAGRWSRNAANDVIDEVSVIAHDVSTSVSHGKHSFSKCYNDCTVNYANKQRERLLAGSNKVFHDFYLRVFLELRKVEGSNANETQVLRRQVIDGEWNRLVDTFDRKWKSVYDDDEVENYFFKDSSEKKARNRYRSMIQESWDQNKAYRTAMYNTLLTAAAPQRKIARTSAEQLVMKARTKGFQSHLAVDPMIDTLGYWNWGISDIASYRAGNAEYTLMTKPESGEFWVYRMTSSGAIDEITWYTNGWEKGVSSIGTYSVGRKNYLLLSRPDAGKFWIFALTDDGKVGGMTWSTDKWYKGITNIDSFSYRNNRFLLLSKPDSGFWWVFELTADGKVGNMTWNAENWEQGVEAIEVANVNGTNYVLMSKPSTGKFWIARLETSGRIGQFVTSRDYERGINAITSINDGPQTYMVLSAAATGKCWVIKLDAGGTPGEFTWSTASWVKGISSINAYSQGRDKYLLLSKPDGSFWSFLMK